MATPRTHPAAMPPQPPPRMTLAAAMNVAVNWPGVYRIYRTGGVTGSGVYTGQSMNVRARIIKYYNYARILGSSGVTVSIRYTPPGRSPRRVEERAIRMQASRWARVGGPRPMNVQSESEFGPIR